MQLKQFQTILCHLLLETKGLRRSPWRGLWPVPPGCTVPGRGRVARCWGLLQQHCCLRLHPSSLTSPESYCHRGTPRHSTPCWSHWMISAHSERRWSLNSTCLDSWRKKMRREDLQTQKLTRYTWARKYKVGLHGCCRPVLGNQTIVLWPNRRFCSSDSLHSVTDTVLLNPWLWTKCVYESVERFELYLFLCICVPPRFVPVRTVWHILMEICSLSPFIIEATWPQILTFSTLNTQPRINITGTSLDINGCFDMPVFQKQLEKCQILLKKE